MIKLLRRRSEVDPMRIPEFFLKGYKDLCLNGSEWNMYLYISEIFSSDMYALYNTQYLNASQPTVHIYIAVFILVNNETS